MVDPSGNFVNSAGGQVSPGDFEREADSEASKSMLYLNAVSVWAYLKNKATSSKATGVRIAFGNAYCFDAISTPTTCRLGSDLSGVLTAGITSPAQITFNSNPTASGQAACKF